MTKKKRKKKVFDRNAEDAHKYRLWQAQQLIDFINKIKGKKK